MIIYQLKKTLHSFDSPETRYCPANVYRNVIKTTENKFKLHINFQNCLHCKTCDIKDPYQNIDWVPPEGGDGQTTLECKFNNTKYLKKTLLKQTF